MLDRPRRQKGSAETPIAVDWPADQIERRDPRTLKPHPNNARRHSKEQIAFIARSMLTNGVTTPALVDEADVILYGHARIEAAKLNLSLGHERFTSFPVVVARGWSDEKKRGYLIADNQSALMATWDDSLLRSELTALDLGGFDLTMTGFNTTELESLLAVHGQDGEGEPRMSKRDAAMWFGAWRELMVEWRAVFADVLNGAWFTPDHTKAALAIHFLRARLRGHDIPRTATLPYTPHRMFTPGAEASLFEIFDRAIAEESVLRSMIWTCQDRPAFHRMFSPLAIRASRAPAEFPASLARDLINEFCPKGGAVLDPCHGWGGRMLGFLLSHARRYVGFDVDPKTVAGVRAIFDDISPLAGRKTEALVECVPFEDAQITPRPGRFFDFALTSPPYYDVEKYGGELSSWARYADFDAWVAGFFRPLIEKTAGALKRGSVFALQLGNQTYPLEKKAREIGKAIGVKYLETRPTGMRNNYNETDEEDGEVVVLFRVA